MEQDFNNITLETLFKNIQFLTQKCNMLEKEVGRLSTLLSKPSYTRTRMARIKTVPEIVNMHQPIILWKEYATVVSPSQMKYIFEGDMVYAIEKIIDNETVELPLAACKEKSNTIYVYGAQNELWTIFSEKQFNEWMEAIKHQILREFLKWKAEEEKKMCEDENPEGFIDKCMRYLQRIICGNKTKENEAVFKSLCKKFKQR